MNRYHICYSRITGGIMAECDRIFTTLNADSMRDAVSKFYEVHHPSYDCIIREIWLLKVDL